VRRAHGDRGAIGGAELLPLGVLVFVGGLLLVANAWAVVDARLMASSAAREAVRAYVEAGDGAQAVVVGTAAAQAAVAAHAGDPDAIDVELLVDGGFGRCARVVAVVRYDVAAFALGTARIPVEATATELVDPFRDGLTGAGCAA
jgi:hypothetical protein